MIPVFYTPRQVVAQDLGTSPSARKPAEVVTSWQIKGFPIEVLAPQPATTEEFYAAHDRAFVDGVLACRRANGFGTRHPEVAASLPWTTGSLLSAARHVRRASLPVAVSPTSGFHHADRTHAQGFCTFNGLMVTALALRAEGVQRIGILDCDEHFGNGTADIIEDLGMPDVRHYTYGAEDIGRGDGDAWLARLPNIVKGFEGCDLLLYQAGADPHTDDPLGRGILSTNQLARRDRIVFETVKRLGIPIVWNLAGGYQKPLRKVLDIHDNTMRACVETFLG